MVVVTNLRVKHSLKYVITYKASKECVISSRVYSLGDLVGSCQSSIRAPAYVCTVSLSTILALTLPSETGVISSQPDILLMS